ncbi:MAG: iron-containing alcohol dehydrogenase [Gammaproteobacteria bacterium]|nr:iron-containing alcohol dehydrogenase [Gammaproteobacteria bacterium]
MIAFNPTFELASVPRIRFGSGRLESLPELISDFGGSALLVTGAQFLQRSGHWDRISAALTRHSIRWHRVQVSREPSPEMIDEAVAAFHGRGIDVVVGIGGGSVLDAAKAIAGLLPFGNSVMDHLEGVGRGIAYRGPSTPLIAVPTTAGTGSETTKNAVLSRPGKSGFKKSFRDDALVAHTALIDPSLLRDTPRELMAAQGMDAFTQLLESYLSRAATPLTDALAWSGIEAFSDAFMTTVEAEPVAREEGALARLAYASMISGITLANAGLGSVHALAGPLGGLFPIPHGVACGTLLAEATAINLQLLRQQDPQGVALWKYARVARLLAKTPGDAEAHLPDLLAATLRAWIERLAIPRLGQFGILEADLPALVAGSRGANLERNPASMSDRDVTELLRRRL